MTGPLDLVTLHRVNSLDELDACRRWMGERHDGLVCADTESAGLNPHRDAHRLSQVGDKGHGWAFGPAWFGAVNELLVRYPGRIGMFNSGYDMRVWLHQDGVDLGWHRIDDSQSAGHLISSRAVNKLKPRAALDVDPRAMAADQQFKAGMRKQGWTWATVPEDWQPYWAYGAMDPVLTSWSLDKYLPQVMTRYRGVYDLDLAYARLCARMCSAGMAIDVPYILDHQQKISSWAEQAMAWLRETCGITSVNSNEQVGAALRSAGVAVTKWTPGGLPSCDKDTLEGYAAGYPHAAPLIRTIMGARKAGKIVNDVFGKFLMLANDGVVHYSIHPLGAQRTSRSSVTDPAMQTFDRDIPIIRGSYVPRPGNVFISIDADQIELRLAAHLSGDEKLIADLIECDAAAAAGDKINGSFFLKFSRSIYGPITKSDPRYTTTKNTVYSMTYGSGKETAARTAGVPVDEIVPVYDGFKYAYPQLARYSRQLVNRLERMRGQPYVETIGGRRLEVDRHKCYSGVDYCLAPQTRVLHADMTWRPAGEVRKGDRLVAFDENQPEQVTGGPSRPRRLMKTADVEVVSVIDKPCVTVHTDQGPVTCSTDHLWLVDHKHSLWISGKHTSYGQAWRAAADLKSGDKIMSMGRPWQPDDSRLAGWLAGALDGEGHLSFCGRNRRGNPTLAFSQNPGLVLNKYIDGMAQLDLPVRLHQSSGTTSTVVAAGGWIQVMRALGTLQPVRWRDKYHQIWEGTDLPRGKATVLAVDQIGTAEVVAIQTSTRTLVAEGMLSHNCIQGSAAELMKYGGVKLDAAGLGDALRLSIHDEWLCEVPREDAAEALALATKVLTDRDSFKIPITWSGSILSERWVKQ